MKSTLREYNNHAKAIAELIDRYVVLWYDMIQRASVNVNNRRFTEFLIVTSTSLYQS